jgi:pimeloyl-ACP methyl ester carboxylesterase
MNFRTVGVELGALGAAAISLPWGSGRRLRFDPFAPHPRPVLLVHGLFGHPTNFLLLRTYLASRGIRNFYAFSYLPRVDYPRLSDEVARLVDGVREETGAEEIDVVGHSLGGLIGRYVTSHCEQGDGIRRLVTLGSPYFTYEVAPGEMAVFGEHDPFVPPPRPPRRRDGTQPAVPSTSHRGRLVVVRSCGHWGLLYHPAVLREIGGFLTTEGDMPAVAGAAVAGTSAA